MFCTNCGAQIDDKAVVCPACGVPTTGNGVIGEGVIKTYLVESILATIFCCALPSIVAIVYATQVDTCLARGDIDGAKKCSSLARIWLCVGVGFGVFFLLFSFFLGVIAQIN